MKWWSILFFWKKKPLCIHPNKYIFEILQLSQICENLLKSLDYFYIKKYLLIFYNLTRNCYDVLDITFYMICNLYIVDLWSN